jgi:hypothetical protein
MHMDCNSTYRHYRRGDEFAIIDLRRGLREVKVRDRNSVEHWRHENLGNPEGKSIVVLAAEGDRILSQFVLAPRTVQVLGRRAPSYQSMEVMTRSSERRKGHFTRLGFMAQGTAERLGCDVLWAFPNRNSIAGFVDRFGWNVVGQVPLLVRPLLGPVRARRPWFSRNGESHDGMEVREVDAFDDRIEDLLEDLNGSHPVVFPRTVERLNWRYTSIADRVYRKYVYHADGGRDGFAVYRIARMAGLVVVVIMELHARDGMEWALRFLETGLARLQRKYRPRLALAMTPDHTWQHRVLRRAGFARLPDGLGPHRFRLTIRVDEHMRPLSDVLHDMDSWYLSFGDNDVF